MYEQNERTPGAGRYRIDLRGPSGASSVGSAGHHPDRFAEAMTTPRLEPVTSFSMGGTGLTSGGPYGASSVGSAVGVWTASRKPR